MKPLSKPLFLRLIFILGLVLVGGISLLGLTLWQNSATIRDLAPAKSRWAARSFSHYQIALRAAGHPRPRDCRHALDIQNEKVVQVLQNTCGDMLPESTITDLFGVVEGNQQMAGLPVLASDTTGIIHVDAIYDVDLGYPHQVEIRVDPNAPWQHWDYLHRVLAGDRGLLGFDPSITYTVLSLTPLP